MIWTLLIFVILVALVITNRLSGKTYVAKVLLFLDIFFCALITRNPDMTLSARCALYCKHDPPLFWYLLGKTLEALQRGHLEMAIAADIARAQQAIAILQGSVKP